jgi:hypothetical protein
MRKLIATTCLFVIVASGLFIATQAARLYADYQQEQASTLDRKVADQQRLLDRLERLYKH